MFAASIQREGTEELLGAELGGDEVKAERTLRSCKERAFWGGTRRSTSQSLRQIWSDPTSSGVRTRSCVSSMGCTPLMGSCID